MGGGRFDSVTYSNAASTRALTGTATFAYSDVGKQTGQIHPNLDPARIKNKPFGKLESRDSEEHPNSNAILVSFDVTGSNVMRAAEAQEKLPNLMALITKYLPDPQIAFAANDDYEVSGMSAQVSDFESDNRIDEHLRNIVLVGNGGPNSKESYDLILYAAARKTVLDCVEKRGRKGYLFLYADEPLYTRVSRAAVNEIYGDGLQADIPIEDIIKEAKQLYHVYLISTVAPLYGAEKQYATLFGQENVFSLQNPKLICELIASIIGMKEANLTDDDMVKDLVASGADKDIASTLVTSVRRSIRFEEEAA